MANYVLEVNATNFQVDTDTFVANYSTFLTHVPLSVLNNGTYSIGDTDTFVANYSDYLDIQDLVTNNTFAQLTVLNNGTYSAVDTDTFVANYSTFLTHATTTYVDAQNTSQTNLINLNNESMGNYVLEVNATNFQIDTDTFVANYSVFLTHATTTYVDEQNTSQTNYIGVQNTSIVNWVSNVFNVTRNNYVDVMDLVFNNSVVNWVNDIFYTKTEVEAINTSMKNYVDDTFISTETDPTFIAEKSDIAFTNISETFTANVTVQELVFEGAAALHINDNVTCVNIYGSSSVLRVC